MSPASPLHYNGQPLKNLYCWKETEAAAMEGVKPYPPELALEYRHKGWWLGATLLDAFDRTCDILPHKEALVDDKTRLTFSQLRGKAQKAALAFLRVGLTKESLVLFQLPNWAETVAIYLGLQMIGAIPILCLPRHGRRELERFCALTQPVAWIGPDTFGKIEYSPMIKGLAEKFSSLKHLIVVNGNAPAGFLAFSRLAEEIKIDNTSIEYLNRLRPSPDDIVHFQPTGGSTGLPKLVPKTQDAHISYAYYNARASESDAKDISLVIAPISHQAPQVWELAFLALFGRKLVLSTTSKAKEVLEIMEREKITRCFMVPAMMADIVKEPDLDKYHFSPSLSIITGGSHASPEVMAAMCQKLKCQIFSTYGMTEGAGTTTRSYDSFEVVANTVGWAACPYSQYQIIDEAGKEVPQGQVGELVIKGPGVFTGYYKSEEENQLFFTKDGFFRTGDLAKFTQEGNIIIAGRKKDLIKRGGETIIPIEIEDMVAGYPKVARVAVVGMPDPRLGERICAYIQPIPGEEISFDEIIAYLKAQGASVMLLPERIEIVEELPVTATNKIYKPRLREDIAQKLQAEGKL